MNHRYAILALLLVFVINWAAQAKENPTKAAEKEWTFLLFLNGHNNLDTYGDMNLNQMEQVGSTDKVNLVVQWASLRAPTKRLLILKDQDNERVTSPVVEQLGVVDMGDWHKLVEFVDWGVRNYPAKKYFVAIWNHGNGWHLRQVLNGRLAGGPIDVKDISYDDISNHKITTEQLGKAMGEIAHLTGGKVELYGSDACLMAMAEVASEMKDSVKYFVGSEEVEPGEGWPYNMFIRQWVANPTMDGAALGKILTEQFVTAYQGGIYGHQEVTFSALDLSKLGLLEDSLRDLTAQLMQLDPAALARVRAKIDQTQAFWNSDYRDLKHFMMNLTRAAERGVTGGPRVADAVSNTVILSQSSDDYANSHGISIWLPYYSTDWSQHGARYKGLKFHEATGWGDFIGKLYGGTL